MTAVRARVLVVALLAWLAVGSPGAAAGSERPEDWGWPVDGPVVRPFDPPTTRYGAGHRGADLAAPVGTPVRTAAAGRVSYAGLLAGRGVVVVVHGALRSTYEPVAASVRVGDVVAAGAVLGQLTGGGHCLPGCLHWGLLRGDVYLDPVLLVRRGPSRLLPVPPEAAAAPAAPQVRRHPSPSAAPVALRPVAQPGLDLRAAQLPWGAAALVALIAGLLLVRPSTPKPPRRPPEAPPAEPAQPVVTRPAPAGRLVDLGAERSRRRIV